MWTILPRKNHLLENTTSIVNLDLTYSHSIDRHQISSIANPYNAFLQKGMGCEQ